MRQTFGETTSRAERTSLPQQLAGPLGLDLVRPDRLQRDVHPQLQVEGAEHLAHAAAAEHLADLVALAQDPARARAGRGSQARRRTRPPPTHPPPTPRRVLEREAQQALRAQPPDLGVRGQLGSRNRDSARPQAEESPENVVTEREEKVTRAPRSWQGRTGF